MSNILDMDAARGRVGREYQELETIVSGFVQQPTTLRPSVRRRSRNTTVESCIAKECSHQGCKSRSRPPSAAATHAMNAPINIASAVNIEVVAATLRAASAA